MIESVPCEVPILVVGRQLLSHVGLDDVDPVGESHLARLLEELAQSPGELLLVHVLHAHGRHLGSKEGY